MTATRDQFGGKAEAGGSLRPPVTCSPPPGAANVVQIHFAGRSSWRMEIPKGVFGPGHGCHSTNKS